MTGRLYLIGTPIGHLGDITLRAIETLRAVGRIYAEDTRRSRVLLQHLGIEGKKLLSLHAHSSDRAIETAISILREGDDIALVTDAGMPSISDPGTELVRAAHEAGLNVTIIPGPSAVTSAVALSGLVDGPFSFFGFLPRKGKKRGDALRWITESRIPVVLFESPHRVQETLVDLARACGPRPVAICRELTKKFEEVIVSTLDHVSQADFRKEWLGELTLVVSGDDDREPITEEDFDLEARARALLQGDHSVRETTQLLTGQAQQAGLKLSRREIYARVQLLSEADPSPDEEE